MCRKNLDRFVRINYEVFFYKNFLSVFLLSVFQLQKNMLWTTIEFYFDPFNVFFQS